MILSVYSITNPLKILTGYEPSILLADSNGGTGENGRVDKGNSESSDGVKLLNMEDSVQDGPYQREFVGHY